ncbi:MAG: HD domain-containing protein [Bacteroidales bacterium]|nr:HD domain-containing protein [Bacteroidales bacterium]
MNNHTSNKRKIINDPVHGFIKINADILFDVIEHPYFQRLRRIKQLGLTHYVYPGATHSRFQHALGSFHLMNTAINVLRQKGHEITMEEEEAASLAILLHDVGHGPFSHTLESTIIQGIHHEQLSLLFMHSINREMNGALGLAISVFKDEYPKKFLHQLVSSQLDMDRLDYLKRDSYFTGVTEGAIGSDRIVRMLNVVDDKLVVDIKGIYSVEKFLIARRLMHWQVYLHKAAIAAELLLQKVLIRARSLARMDEELFCSTPLRFFLYNKVKQADFQETINTSRADARQDALSFFALLDDNDIMTAVKEWINNRDPVLSRMCYNLTNRNLSRIDMQSEPFPGATVEQIRRAVQERYEIKDDEVNFFVETDTISNSAYSAMDDKIQIRYNDGTLKDVSEASDLLNPSALSGATTKHYLYYPKEILKY